jgi:hypothetical protein
VTKEITETLHIVVPVKVRSNGTPEARKVALRLATCHIDAWSSEAGGVGIVSDKKGIRFQEEEAPK